MEIANSRSGAGKDQGEPGLSFWARRQGSPQRVIRIMSKEHRSWPQQVSTGIWVN